MSGATDEISFALLPEVSRAGSLTADADERGEVTERFALVGDDGSESGVNDGGILVESGLQLILCTAVVAIGSGNGTNESGIVHLLGELWEDFRDFHAIDRSLDGIEFPLGLATGLGIPSVEVTHATAVPEENDVFGLGLVGIGFCQKLANGHAKHACTEGLQHVASGE